LLAQTKSPAFYREWMDSFFARDIQRLFAFRDMNRFNALFEYVLRQSGGQLEVTKTAAALGITRPTVESHLQALEITHALTLVRPFSGGGLKELAVRAAQDAKGNDLLQFLKNYFMNAATANVSKSALEAKKMGYLSPDDVIVFNPYELLHVAKVEARALFDAGYRPPLRALVPVAGRYGMATIMAQLVNMRDGGFISAHDYKLGAMIAEIVCGGEVEQGSLVSEQWLLDLERKAFMELLNHPKTQERIMGMMQTGKPVRN